MKDPHRHMLDIHVEYYHLENNHHVVNIMNVKKYKHENLKNYDQMCRSTTIHNLEKENLNR